MWLVLAIGSAVFAALVSVLGKKGLSGVSSSVATAIRSAVALGLAWTVAAISGSIASLPTLDETTYLFLILSGLATGLSWLFYFKALAIGKVAEVMSVDRLSLLFTGLLGIWLFGETENLMTKLIGLVIVVIGTYVLIFKGKSSLTSKSTLAWIPWAVTSMAFAVATTLLAKVGLSNVDSTLATAIRTSVVVVASFALVLITGERQALKSLNRSNVGYLIGSGLATGASWLCFFGAIQIGQVSLVAPIDKLSIVVAAILSFWLLREKLTKRDLVGLALITLGTVTLFIPS